MILAHLLLLLVVKKNRKLSLRQFLRKMFTLHHHIRSILRIAWSTRLAPFLEGQFKIVSVPAAPNDLFIQFSQQQVIYAAFPPKDQTTQNVRKMVYDQLLDRFQTKAKDEGIDLKMKTGSPPELSLKKINVHAECTLLAYHLQHPEIQSYNYFGGSKLSCHACGTFFSAFNNIAESFGHPQFFTKGSHDNLHFCWPSPSLLSQVQQTQLKPGARSLDIEVRKEMNKILGKELVGYVDKLRQTIEVSSPPQSDSIAASGDSCELLEGASEADPLRTLGVCKLKLACLILINFFNLIAHRLKTAG